VLANPTFGSRSARQEVLGRSGDRLDHCLLDTGDRVAAEDDARCKRTHHLLDEHVDPQLACLYAHGIRVGGDGVSFGREPHRDDRLSNVGRTHVENRSEPTGERVARVILRVGGGANGVGAEGRAVL